MIAIVVGGAQGALAELEEAKRLCASQGVTPSIFVTNDCIPLVPGEVIAVTRHPSKLKRWLEDRESNGHPQPVEVWAHRAHALATHLINDDWNGSTGLIATRVAIEKSMRVILAGVPMTVNGMHIVRKERWLSCTAFRCAWDMRRTKLAPYVRSLSGWTMRTFGRPDPWFINEESMLYDIFNPTRATRVIYPQGNSRELKLPPNHMARGVEIMPQVLEMLLERTDDLTVREADGGPEIINAMLPDKPLIITGMYGIGDNIHQRAALRELMKSHEVWLRSCHVSLYHDLIEQGLKVLFMPTKLRAQARTILRERHLFSTETPPRNAHAYRVWYHKPEIDRYGSILGAMMAAFRLPGLKEPDFSLPIRPEWTQAARQLIDIWKPSKPILIYRPILLRKEWDGSSRNPETRAYDVLFRDIRDRFFVVSIADLETGKEWIAGYPIKADIELHNGELDFPTMAALFKEAQLVFSPAGFGPILAQSVGTPSIVVYGGRESFRTTDSAGVHLAPTLGINPIIPCDCHSHRHACKKKIDIPAAQLMVKDFVFRWCGVADHARPSPAAASASAPAETKTEITASVRSRPVLLFGTTYIDSPERMRLLEQWVEMHQATGGDICELLIVDSASPCLTLAPCLVKIERFADNIGHLAKGGNDGWGRAFCRGLELAIEGGFEYAVHIEGDSLFRLPIAPIIEDMRKRGAKVASAIVRGMRKDHAHWVETGLMVFEVEYLKQSGFIHRYDWPSRRAHPVPEAVVYGLVAPELSIMPWRVWRDDRRQITSQNVERFNLDWLSHCDPSKGAYERYLQAYRPKADAPATALPETQTAVSEAPGGLLEAGPLKLNFGCGTNRLAGWHNMDAEVDISKPLPFADGSASRVLAEHVVEHITYYEALDFFKEVRRVLRPGGAFRVCVPSIEQIGQCGNLDYFRFTQKWQSLGPNAIGAMHAILYAHGHKTAWTASLMHWSLVYAGFNDVRQVKVGESDIADLVGVEGHGKVIGQWNDIEACVFEAVNGQLLTTATLKAIEEAAGAKVAIVLGGAVGVEKEFEEAKAICAEAGVDYTVIATNDQIVHCKEPVTAVTLHPDKLEGWLGERRARGYPTPFQVWAHRNAVHVTNTTRDWSGSSGLFGVQVAWKKMGKSHVLLAGVPMSVEAGHFLRNRSWHACKVFLAAWQTRRAELSSAVRSMSGWTRETFGAPDESWLKG